MQLDAAEYRSARTLEQVERIHIVDVIGRSRSSHNGVNERIQDGLEARFGIAFVANVWAPDDRSIIKAPGTCRRCRVALAQCMGAASQASLSSGAVTVTTFDDYARFEEDRRNLLHEWQGKATGSGLKWFGEKFKNQRQKAYSGLFSMPNLTGEPVRLEAEMALRAGRSSRFEIEIRGQTFQCNSVGSIILRGVNDNITEYARIARLEASPTLSGGDINLTLSYPYPGGTADESEGWLDWIQINARRTLTMSGSQMHFRSLAALAQASATYQMDGASSRIRVWDISNPLQPKVQAVNLSGSQLSFSAPGQTLRQFIAFDSESGFFTPEAVGKIGNQNYHGLENIDMVIVYHADFTAEAQQLAQHRTTYNDFSVALVRIDSLYNEFSSGRQEPSAIRDFAKMLYERNPRFRYLLLFGDASFDYNDSAPSPRTPCDSARSWCRWAP